MAAEAYSIGDWCIDTKNKKSVDIIAKIDGSKEIYVVEDDEENVYLATGSQLIEYDKCWFDRQKGE